MARKSKDIRITKVIAWDWTIPYYGNDHSIPYGTLKVTGEVDGKEVTQYCKTRGDRVYDEYPFQFVVFQGVRFIVRNEGSLHCPKLTLSEWKKEKIGNRWMYTDNA